MPRTIHIAMLNADTPVPAVLPTWGTYGDMFRDLLVAAASRIAPDVEIQSTNYDTQQLEYPKSLAAVDVVLITGSASSSYDDKEWIRRLDQFVVDVYTNHPHVRIFGSCFGHQIVCDSLLRSCGARVEKDPNGWELGVQEISLHEAFREHLGQGAKSSLRPGSRETPQKLRMQFVHADHVFLKPEALPSSWTTVGNTPHCAVQGVYEPSRILTFQGHFEFNRFVNTELLKVFGATWKPEVLKQTLEAIDADDDADMAAEMVVQFILEAGVAGQAAVTASGSHQVTGGLLTPPLAE